MLYSLPNDWWSTLKEILGACLVHLVCLSLWFLHCKQFSNVLACLPEDFIVKSLSSSLHKCTCSWASWRAMNYVVLLWDLWNCLINLFKSVFLFSLRNDSWLVSSSVNHRLILYKILILFSSHSFIRLNLTLGRLKYSIFEYPNSFWSLKLVLTLHFISVYLMKVEYRFLSLTVRGNPLIVTQVGKLLSIILLWHLSF